MKKPNIARLFLYRHRFGIGYTVLGIIFLAIIILMPFLAPSGLSAAEIESVKASDSLHLAAMTSGDLVDVPYHTLQKISISLLGLTPFAIKLPSIIIAILLGLLLILLLNRWFKNNVALLSSIITVLSTPFLYLAGSGTPLIMLVFWPTLLLWLGSKIQGEKKPKPKYCLLFALALLLSIFTPYMVYFAIFIVLFAFLNPHLRFTIKSLPKIPLVLTAIVILAGLTILALSFINHPDTVATLTFTKTPGNFRDNLKTGITPFFIAIPDQTPYLSPLFGLAVSTLAIIGLVSTVHGFFASRNAIASCFIIFALILSGINPNAAFILILSIAILVAHGLRYTLEKWYGLFPENPYARILGLIPIVIFLGLIIVSDVIHYVYGYRYSPTVAPEFSTDLQLIRDNLLDKNATLLTTDDEYNFYKLLAGPSEEKTDTVSVNNLVITKNQPETPSTLALTRAAKSKLPEGCNLTKIITNSKSADSNRLYLYICKNSTK